MAASLDELSVVINQHSTTTSRQSPTRNASLPRRRRCPSPTGANRIARHDPAARCPLPPDSGGDVGSASTRLPIPPVTGLRALSPCRSVVSFAIAPKPYAVHLRPSGLDRAEYRDPQSPIEGPHVRIRGSPPSAPLRCVYRPHVLLSHSAYFHDHSLRYLHIERYDADEGNARSDAEPARRQGKPTARWGRKTTGLPESAGLPEQAPSQVQLRTPTPRW